MFNTKIDPHRIGGDRLTSAQRYHRGGGAAV